MKLDKIPGGLVQYRISYYYHTVIRYWAVLFRSRRRGTIPEML